MLLKGPSLAVETSRVSIIMSEFNGIRHWTFAVLWIQSSKEINLRNSKRS